ncbi:MAG TPA: Flp family type IVb pilin [Stellaceae bacterium]|nr:Flp family type IVb pilin [Stellaceae bacterium]
MAAFDNVSTASVYPGRFLSKGTQMCQLISRFRRNQEGAALVEYGLLVGLIAAVCVIAVSTLGTELSAAFSKYAADLSVLTR